MGRGVCAGARPGVRTPASRAQDGHADPCHAILGARRMTLRKDAYTLEALIEAGVPAQVARTLLADGARAIPMRPRVALTGRRRAPLTTAYVWGPDAAVLLADASQGDGKWL